MRFRLRALLASALVTPVLLACSSDSSTRPFADDATVATRAAETFEHLADSLGRNGSSTMGATYGALAATVRMVGRVSPVVLTIDGVPITFLATAQQIELSAAPCPPGEFCSAVFVPPTVVRTLVAWQRDDPRRLVQLVAEGSEQIGALLYPTFAPSSIKYASLVYLDGKGGTYFGTSGTQSIAAATSETPCVSTRRDPMLSGAVHTSMVSVRCTQADFTATFDGSAEPSAFLVHGNTAAGTHTLSMSAQTVQGARLEFPWPSCGTCGLPGFPGNPTSPISVSPSDSLPATLTATVDSVVTLTLTVSNPSNTPVKVTFPSGQRYDFVVRNAATGASVWRWSIDKLFAQALGQETIPPTGSLSYSERWTPAFRGDWVVEGMLTSLSHRASASTRLTVP